MRESLAGQWCIASRPACILLVFVLASLWAPWLSTNLGVLRNCLLILGSAAMGVLMSQHAAIWTKSKIKPNAMNNKEENYLDHLDEIAHEAWEGNYSRVDVLSKGERLYVALASGRMRELCPSDSIAYAVDRVGPEWMAHMLENWRNSSQPKI